MSDFRCYKLSECLFAVKNLPVVCKLFCKRGVRSFVCAEKIRPFVCTTLNVNSNNF